MTIDLQTNTENKWYTQPNKNISTNQYNWLIKPNIISKAMKKICSKLSVNLLSQQQESILPSEQRYLDPNNLHQVTNNKISLVNKKNIFNNTWVRKVILLGDNIPWEYARVVIPNSTYQAYKNDFESLGGKLIGENLLYNNPKTTRSNFEYTNLSKDNYIYQEIKNYLQDYNINLLDTEVWGRRSIFYIDGIHKLLISEFFLPDIPNYPEN